VEVGPSGVAETDAVVLDDAVLRGLTQRHGHHTPPRATLLTLVLSALLSASWDLHRLAAALALVVSSYGPHSASRVAHGVAALLQQLVEDFKEAAAGRGTDADDAPASPGEGSGTGTGAGALLRVLVTVEALCQHEGTALALATHGALESLLSVLTAVAALGEGAKAHSGLCMVATQALTALYRSLQLAHVRLGLPGERRGGRAAALATRTRAAVGWLVHGCAVAVSRALPPAMAACQVTYTSHA
jgi:hypothetical protein